MISVRLKLPPKASILLPRRCQLQWLMILFASHLCPLRVALTTWQSSLHWLCTSTLWRICSQYKELPPQFYTSLLDNIVTTESASTTRYPVFTALRNVLHRNDAQEERLSCPSRAMQWFCGRPLLKTKRKEPSSLQQTPCLSTFNRGIPAQFPSHTSLER